MARILVIEDNTANVELMTYLLRAFGHEVVSALDGESGIAAALRERPDLILCDVLLPDVDGYAVARTLKADPELAAVPIVAVTALAMETDRERVLAAGFDGYLSKPIEPETFVRQIDQFLAAERRGSQPGRNEGPAPAAPAALAAARARLLVVDDAPTNRELIYQTLAPFGYEVRLAESVNAAWALLAAWLPDLILSDLHMPGEDGFNFVRRVKQDARLANLPFVFISSSIWGEADRERAIGLGVTRFLLRPIEPQALINEVGAALEQGTEPRR